MSHLPQGHSRVPDATLLPESRRMGNAFVSSLCQRDRADSQPQPKPYSHFLLKNSDSLAVKK